jgi:hypothetical protein
MLAVSADSLPDGGWAEYRKTATTKARPMTQPFKVQTTEGVMEGKAGDYLCLDNAGNPYPCAREIFLSSYEPA